MKKILYFGLVLYFLQNLIATNFLYANKEDYFTNKVKPIFEAACIQCHGEKKAEGEYRMHKKKLAFDGGENWPKETIIPKKPSKSSVYWMLIEPEDSEDVMPPKKPLTKPQQEVIKKWILEGAVWPKGITLKEKPRIDFEVNILPILKKGGPFDENQKIFLKLWVDQGAVWPKGFILEEDNKNENGISDNLYLTKSIRELIIEKSTVKNENDMKSYVGIIPTSKAKYEMVAIKGGEFLMGSPIDEKYRDKNEGPQHKIKISPFWMGKYEVSWDMYTNFMINDVAKNKDGSPKNMGKNPKLYDIVSMPTNPYQDMSFGMGTSGYPAICMTQYAANKFCQWLSAQTGHFYRLPTEAEWEYACRAGTNTPYPFPEDKIKEYAVVDLDLQMIKYAKLGTKKPNEWGLYDMIGNVMEWTIDQYVEDSYGKRGKISSNPVEFPATMYPVVVRGGSWQKSVRELRSAKRFFSVPKWRVQDLQTTKSIWYNTDFIDLGFRIVRPLEVPSTEVMHKFWNTPLGS